MGPGIRIALSCILAACLPAVWLSAQADVNQRVEQLMKAHPARPCLSGKEMTSKLGVLYLMDHIESQGMYDLADSGLLPIIKTGGVTADRGWRVVQNNPNAIWVVSAGGPLNWKEETPQAAAERRFPEIVSEFGRIHERWQPRVDYLSIMPCMWEPKSPEQAAWYSEFLVAILPRLAVLGPRPIVLNSGVGGLPTDADVLEPMAPGLRLARHLGGAWGCHGYTLQYSTDANHESWYSLRYRKAYDFFRQQHPDLMELSMILLEGGVDFRGDPDKDGWLARGSLQKYTEWLAWYDEELKKDDYVIGVTLFKIGAPSTWTSFELEPVVPWLLAHYREMQAPESLPRTEPEPETKPKTKPKPLEESGDPDVYIRWAPSSKEKD